MATQMGDAEARLAVSIVAAGLIVAAGARFTFLEEVWFICSVHRLIVGEGFCHAIGMFHPVGRRAIQQRALVSYRVPY